jgi:hypothetical protein
MSGERKYSDAEVKAILERALQGGAGDTSAVGVGHADLVAIGEQVGIAPADMTRAAHDVLEGQLDDEARRAIASGRRRWLGLHAAVFALINGLLFAVNFLTTPGEWWVLFSVFFWGLALALHAGLALGLGASPSAVERERRRLAGSASGKGTRHRVAAASGAEPLVESEPAESVVAHSRKNLN